MPAYSGLGAPELQNSGWADSFSWGYVLGTNATYTQVFYGFDIIPNPTNGKFSFHLNDMETINGVIIIYDLNGNQVWSRHLLDNNVENILKCDIANLVAGIYFVHLVTSKLSSVRKLIKI